MDLISREEAIKELKVELMAEKPVLNVIGVIEKLPTIDAVPVVKGEWVAQDESLTKFMCSVCKSENHEGCEKFCPSCGADMRERW